MLKRPDKLTDDDKQDLADVVNHDGLRGLLYEIEQATLAIEADVLKYDLSSGDERELVRRKCRGEGARKLQIAIERRIASLKAKSETSD